MGSSEVGHMTIGTGRVIKQELSRVNEGIMEKEVKDLPLFRNELDKILDSQGTLHFLGLLSDGGVHSHQNHLEKIIEAALSYGIKKIVIHAFLDGRDVPPKSAGKYLERLRIFLDSLMASNPDSEIGLGTMCGRFYGMDRDSRWKRTEAAWRQMVDGKGAFLLIMTL